MAVALHECSCIIAKALPSALTYGIPCSITIYAEGLEGVAVLYQFSVERNKYDSLFLPAVPAGGQQLPYSPEQGHYRRKEKGGEKLIPGQRQGGEDGVHCGDENYCKGDGKAYQHRKYQAGVGKVVGVEDASALVLALENEDKLGDAECD